MADTPTIIVRPTPQPQSQPAQQDSNLPPGFGGPSQPAQQDSPLPPGFGGPSQAQQVAPVLKGLQQAALTQPAQQDSPLPPGFGGTSKPLLPDPQDTQMPFTPQGPPTGASTDKGVVAGDSEIRIKLSPLHPEDVFKGGVIDNLKDIGGMMFPYTPVVNFSQAVSYMDLQLVHSNTDYAAYTRTPSVTISITGKFTVQNHREGVYALACLHFLRTVSKSYFGKLDGSKAGLPPPILLLNGYGNYIFNQERVILKSHSWSFDDSTDGITIQTTGGIARMPSLFSITCELTVVQTPQRMREQFSFDKFASGQLMQPGAGWI